MPQLKQTTALQDIINFCNDKMSLAPKKMLPSERGLYNGYLNIRTKAIELLNKERQQHLETFVAGAESGLKDRPFNAEQYFEQTFKQ